MMNTSRAAGVQRVVCRMNTPTSRAVLALKSRTGCSGFRITSTLNREPFLSDTSDLRTDDLIILHMRDLVNSDCLL